VPGSPIGFVPYWGVMGVERHRRLCARGIYLHVYAAGVDVTLRCQYFDDTPGRAHASLYVLTPDGRHVMRRGRAPGRPALERVTAFRVAEGAPFHVGGSR
jgi:hypothetical protein